MDVMSKIAIVLVVGWLGGKAAKRLKLPNVSGYLVFGLLIGPSFTKCLNSSDLESFLVISEFALAAVAFSIGSEFVMKDMMKLGKSIFVITLAEVLGAIILVFLVCYYIFDQNFVFSIITASMSAATAPAATLVVMRQYRSDGPVTRTVLPVVALDDVFGIMAFGIALSIARMYAGGGELSLMQMISEPIIEILGSSFLGFVLGLILVFIAKKANDSDEHLIVTLAMIFVASGLANTFGYSPLLTNIVMGTVLVNVMHNSNRIFFSLNHFTPPLFLLFFTLAGASLDIAILKEVGWLGVGYIISRALGKFIGAWIGAKAADAPPTVQKYMGLALLPQGGISIGLSVLVRQYLPEYSVAITTIIMFSVLIYEVSGPIFALKAIQMAGEVGALDRKAGIKGN